MDDFELVDQVIIEQTNDTESTPIASHQQQNPKMDNHQGSEIVKELKNISKQLKGLQEVCESIEMAVLDIRDGYSEDGFYDDYWNQPPWDYHRCCCGANCKNSNRNDPYSYWERRYYENYLPNRVTGLNINDQQMPSTSSSSAPPSTTSTIAQPKKIQIMPYDSHIDMKIWLKSSQ